MEQVQLCSLLFKDPCKFERLYGLSALIVCWRVDRDVRRCCFLTGKVDVEESLCIGRERWSETEVDLEQRRGRRLGGRFHVCCLG